MHSEFREICKILLTKRGEDLYLYDVQHHVGTDKLSDKLHTHMHRKRFIPPACRACARNINRDTRIARLPPRVSLIRDCTRHHTRALH